jgi:hypothetical protein
VPKSYKCHHCNELIFLSKDKDTANPAERLRSSLHRSKKRTEVFEAHSDAKQGKQNHIELVELDVVEARLNARLKAIEKLSTDAPEISLLDQEKKNLKKCMDAEFAVDVAVRQQKAADAEEFKNDPPERRRRALTADKWRLKRLGEK